ncbi:hypothetical protein GCM10028818_50020 [Spirosoma horti]
MSKANKQAPDPTLIEYNKGVSYLKGISRISDCFYHKKEECSGPIKQAHSLQRNGRLSVIEGEVNGENKLYTFTSSTPNEHGVFGDLKPIGKAVASTFFGFCDHHDTVLFSDIENFPYDDSDKHNFLHSYRSFAHTYHTRKEGLKGFMNQEKYKTPYHDQRIRGYEMSLLDAERSKIKLDRMIETQSYSELEYLVHIIGRAHPVACASIITPTYYYNDELFNFNDDETIPYSDIMLTVLPDKNQTLIIMACFPDDTSGIKFLDQLNSLPHIKLERAISSLMISCVENTFFAPALWNALGPQGQKILLSELEYNLMEHASPDFSLSGFYHSKTNFFDPKLSIKRLGINS